VIEVQNPVAPAFLDKDLITDQTYRNIIVKFNNAGIGFDGCQGTGPGSSQHDHGHGSPRWVQ
jgi:hypothetical protein